LRSPINNVASLVTLLKEHQFSPEEFSSLIPELEKSLSETTNFMSLLLQWTQSQNDGLVANKTRFDLQPVISKSVEHLASSLEAKQLKLKAHVEDFEVFADQNMIDLVIRNLLSNAIKFSNPNGKIEISAVKEVNEMVSIHVVDYGVGIDEKRTELFFDVSQKNTTLGTAREKGFGMGLILWS
jgi:two-component system sensor histidine kinase/response regulator